MVARNAWRLGLAIIAVALLTSRGTTDAPVHLNGHTLAVGGGPTNVLCGPLPAGVTTWSAAGSPYILPATDPNLPNPCPAFPLAGQPEPAIAPGVVVGDTAILLIDASLGPVQIFSHGAGIDVMGGELETINTTGTNSVTFDAEPEVASWDGIRIFAGVTRKGDASLSYVTIQHALTGINITSGATSSPDDSHYGLTVRNSDIVVSYFDGIDSINTPISVTGQADGRSGTLNNIGSFGIKVAFDGRAPAISGKALDVEGMTFGSSVPFAESGCPPLQPCAAGTIGNDAIQGTFVPNAAQPAFISNNKFFRAGSYGLELANASNPVVTKNTFDCNGTGSTQPKVTCLSNLPNKFPPIYLSNVTADLESNMTLNYGQRDGLEAIVFNGTVTSGTFNWKTATTDPLLSLGYLLNGDLNMVGGTFKVPAGGIVKAKNGTINLTGATLDASDTTAPNGAKVFTSLRDSTVGVDAGCSVFIQACAPPSPLPAGEWGGINLIGSPTNAAVRAATTGTITNTRILYANTAVHIANGNTLAISGSSIGPTFADGVLAEATPISVTGTTFGCPAGPCSGPGNGNHGILADFGHAGTLPGGLKIGGPNAADKNTFQGSVNEAIRGVSLAGQTVAIQNNKIQNAGAVGTAGSAGIYLQGADNLTLLGNDATASGTGSLHYPAIWLDGVRNADFNGAIMGNTGSGNGLDAIAFHGDTKALTWLTMGRGALLGYLVDGNLIVNGALKLDGDYAPVLVGRITVKTGGITATNGAVLTSLKEQRPSVPSCGSVFVPRVSGVCSGQAAGDWKGLVLDPDRLNLLTDSEIRYATTGITMDKPSSPASPAPPNLRLLRTNILNGSADGIATKSSLSINQGTFSNLSGRGVAVDLTHAGTGASLVIDLAMIQATGNDGVQAMGLAGQIVSITGIKVDHAGGFGINLAGGSAIDPKDVDHLTLKNNTVTYTAVTFPAIYLNGFSGAFANVSGNIGASNGVDAIAFHGTITDDLVWQTAYKTTDPNKQLGYILDDSLTMQAGHTLTVNAGDIVKVGNGGLLDLQGVNLKADDTGNSIQKVFTSLTDDTVGVATCYSAILRTGCTGAAKEGDWGGISLNGSGANGTLVNAAVRYAKTGILITSQALSTSGSSAFGLVLSRSSIGPSLGDGINAVKTAISVIDSAVSGGTHGVSFDLSGLPTPVVGAPPTPLRLSGNRFMSTSAEAILGQALAGQPVWITDNRIQGAGTYGIRLLNADQVVLRNNNVVGSGVGPGPPAGRYPAIYLPAVTADFVQDIRANVGSGNGLDAFVFDGKVTSDLTWITPSNTASTHALGYLLDGGLTLQGGNLTVGAGDVVKSLGGPITINGGTITATGAATPGSSKTSLSAIFTSLKDNPVIPASPPAPQPSPIDVSDAGAVSCPSVLVANCIPGPGDWGGLVITSNAAGLKGSGAISYGLINYANTAISLDSGPISASPEPVVTNFRLTVVSTKISNASKDGINSLDTPFSVDSSTIQNVGANGIIGSFFSPANCSSTTPPLTQCVRLNITNTQITGTGKDGIIANGLSGQPTVISGNTVTDAGTYGIRLVGADQLTLTNNHVRKSAPPSTTPLRYPAIYLNSIKGDFETNPGAGSIVQGNNGKWTGLDAIVFHGEATKKLTWITAVAAPSGPLPVADVTFGYLLDGPLVVDGDFVTNGDIVKIMNGGIKINGGSLQSLGTTFTSLRDNPGLPACHSVFIPDACPIPPATLAAATDWSGINIDAADSVFNNGKLLYASSGVTINSATLKLKSTLITGLTGYAVTTSGTASAQIDCASIHGNGGGISANGGTTTAVTYSNLFGNNLAGKDFNATVAATATNDWWGQPSPVASQYSGSVTVVTPLPQEAPTFKLGAGTIATSSTNTNSASGKFGKGTLTVTLTADREVDASAPLSVSFLGPAETVPHLVIGTWMGDNLTWVGTTAIDPLANVAGLNTLAISGAKSCVPDGNNVMTPETGSFTLDFGKATVPGPGTAQNIGSKSATLTESVNPNGWSNQKDTYVFFQYRLDVGTYDASVIAGIQAGTLNPTTLLGYQTIGHLSAPVPVTAQVSQLLTPATVYDYRAVAVDLNGITTGPDHPFTTLGTLDHFVMAAIPSPQTAGTAFSAQATAYDLGNNVLTDYLGSAAVVSGNLSTAPTGNCSGPMTTCPPKYGTLSWSSGVGTIGGATAYVAEDNRTLTITDGSVSKTSGTFKVNPIGAATLALTYAGPVVHTVPFNLTVTAKDLYSNTATSYTGKVHFTSTDPAPTLPADYTFTTGVGNDNGVHTFSVTLSAAGSPTVTVKDVATPTITGTVTVTVT